MGPCCREASGQPQGAECCNAHYCNVSFLGSLLWNRLLRPGTDTTVLHARCGESKKRMKRNFRNPHTLWVRIYLYSNIYTSGPATVRGRKVSLSATDSLAAKCLSHINMLLWKLGRERTTSLHPTAYWVQYIIS